MTQEKIQGYIRDLLFILLALYFSQGFLYPQGTIISQSILAVIMTISGIYSLKTIFRENNKNSIFKIWTLLFLMNIIGYLLFTPEYGGYYFLRFKKLLFVFLIFYPFYFFADKGVLKSKHLVRFFIIYLPVAMGQYFYNMFSIVEVKDRAVETVVNNVAYLFVYLMPYVFLFKRKKVISIGAMFLLMYFIIQGSKRGAILVGGMGLALFMFYQLRTLEGRNKLWGFIGSLIAIGGMGYYAYTKLMENEYLLQRFGKVSEGSFSGREIIFSNIWRAWLNSGDYLNYLFGFGFTASIRLSGTGNYAHSDWLEMLSNFGLVGVFIYFLFFWKGFKEAFFSDWKSDKKILLIVILGMWLFSTVGSMALYTEDAFVMIIVLTFLIGGKSSELD